MAFGPLGLTHAQFWALTLREYYELVAGWEYSRDIEERDRAYWTWLQLRAWGSPVESPADLLPNRTPTPAADPRNEVAALKRIFNLEHTDGERTG